MQKLPKRSVLVRCIRVLLVHGASVPVREPAVFSASAHYKEKGTKGTPIHPPSRNPPLARGPAALLKSNTLTCSDALIVPSPATRRLSPDVSLSLCGLLPGWPGTYIRASFRPSGCKGPYPEDKQTLSSDVSMPTKGDWTPHYNLSTSLMSPHRTMHTHTHKGTGRAGPWSHGPFPRYPITGSVCSCVGTRQKETGIHESSGRGGR